MWASIWHRMSQNVNDFPSIFLKIPQIKIILDLISTRTYPPQNLKKIILRMLYNKNMNNMCSREEMINLNKQPSPEKLKLYLPLKTTRYLCIDK